MPPSALLFIDGSNFYHALKREKQLPFDYPEFQKLFSEISKKYNLKHIYYYDATKHSKKDPEGYSKQQAFHSRLKKTHDKLEIKTRKLRYLINISDGKIRRTDGIEKIGASPTAIAMLASPLVTTVGAFALLNEQLITIQYIGAALILIGGYMLAKNRKK